MKVSSHPDSEDQDVLYGDSWIDRDIRRYSQQKTFEEEWKFSVRLLTREKNRVDCIPSLDYRH